MKLKERNYPNVYLYEDKEENLKIQISFHDLNGNPIKKRFFKSQEKHIGKLLKNKLNKKYKLNRSKCNA
jgi:hypothetical protein